MPVLFQTIASRLFRVRPIECNNNRSGARCQRADRSNHKYHSPRSDVSRHLQCIREELERIAVWLVSNRIGGGALPRISSISARTLSSIVARSLLTESLSDRDSLSNCVNSLSHEALISSNLSFILVSMVDGSLFQVPGCLSQVSEDLAYFSMHLFYPIQRSPGVGVT